MRERGKGGREGRKGERWTGISFRHCVPARKGKNVVSEEGRGNERPKKKSEFIIRIIWRTNDGRTLTKKRKKHERKYNYHNTITERGEENQNIILRVYKKWMKVQRARAGEETEGGRKTKRGREREGWREEGTDPEGTIRRGRVGGRREGGRLRLTRLPYIWGQDVDQKCAGRVVFRSPSLLSLPPSFPRNPWGRLRGREACQPL